MSQLRTMQNNAKRWALARGLTRTNEVHGLEEYKIPTKECYKFRNDVQQRTTQSTALDVQAGSMSAVVKCLY